MHTGTAAVAWAVAGSLAAGVAGAAPAGGLPPLCPRPQEVRLIPGAAGLDLSAGAAVDVPPGAPAPVRLAAQRLRDALAPAAGPQAAPRPPVSIAWLAADEARGLVGAAPGDMAAAAARLPPEGYLLRTAAAGAAIVGRDAQGALYGIETLIQLARAGGPVPALEIRDAPETPWRAAYCAGGDRLDDRLRRIVRLCIGYKLNRIVLENCDLYRLGEPDVRARVVEAFEFCRDMGLEPVPELQSFGWSQCILPLEPLCVEAAPSGERRFQFGDDGVAQPSYRPGPDLAVRNAGFEQSEGHRLADWQQDDAGVTIFSDESPRGGRCVRIRRDTPGMSRVFQRLACRPDTVYEFQVDMRTEAGPGFSAYFEVYGFPSLEGGREFLACPHVQGTTPWQRRTLRFRTGPATELVAYLRIQSGTGTAWFDNAAIRTARDVPMVNVVETPNQPITVTSLDRRTTYRRGADYDVQPGELRYPFPEDAAPWQIRRLPEGAIAPREEVLVSYEWAQPGDITYCPSEPRTQALMRRVIAETIATLRPRFLHLGHDEPRVINRDARCRRRGLPAHELYVDDVNRLHRWVREADPQCRVMIWADPFRVDAAGKVKVAWFSEEKSTLEDAVRNLPRDIILCPWRYTETDLDLLSRDLASLAAAGFEVTGSPWYDLPNAFAWGIAAARLRRESDRCLGLFLTTWEDRWDALPLTADLMWRLPAPDTQAPGPAAAADLKARYAGFGTFTP